MRARRFHRAAALIATLLSATGSIVAVPASAGAAARAEHVTVALRPHDPAALAAYAQAVSTPGSPDYRDYLTPRQFARRFGAGRPQVDRVRAALRARGLAPGRPSAGGLSLSLTATPAQLRAAHVAGAGLPRSARTAVQSVIGLDASNATHPLAVRAAHRPPTRLRPRSTRARAHAAGPQACPEAAAAAPAQGAYTADEIASAYGFEGLYAAGDEGADTTVALYELEPDDPADIAAFQRCYATHASVSYVHVDGGAGVGAGSDEAAFDIENLIAFAPAAHLLVYQGPNSNSGLPGSGPYDVYSAIVNQDRAQVVSVSWGQCEDQLGAPAAKAENELFQQAAVQGQTIVAAGGDDGAEDCDTGGARSSSGLAVDDPASQPWVTGVGGTTLQTLGPPPVERVWNSGAAGDTSPSVGAGGGGVSSFWAMPSYQLHAAASRHVLRSAARGSVCDQHSRYCREVPDVAADADPATGYEIYWNGADTQPAPAGWQALGGTSGASPVWAALFTLADSSPACAGSTVGYAGPALYRAAAEHYAADFHDVTAGDNDYSGTHGGDWRAGTGYDLSSGLGTPDATPLVSSLCADSMRLPAPAAQSSADHAAVGVALHPAGLRGPGLSYTASHLPPGVRIDTRTGWLIGRPRVPGRYTARVGAHDSRGSHAAATFTWTVGGAPHITSARLAGGRLSLTVRSGAHTPWLRALRIHVPAGLRAGGAAHIAASATAARVSVHGQVVSVSLRAPAPRVAVSIPVTRGGAPPTAALSVGARSGTTGTSTLATAVAGA